MIEIERIPSYIIDVYKQIASSGYEVYLVGGCVRDLLLNRNITDWDMTTNATPEQILQLFPDGFYDNLFGTVGIAVDVIARSKTTKQSTLQQEDSHADTRDDESLKGIIEITTYRTEKNYMDNRHPEQVSWGKTLEEDLQRRDFTINAMAASLNDNIQIIDPYEGQKDLDAKLVRAVGDPNQRFKEDGLRLMRAIRFATQLSFQIEEKTLEAITQDAALLQNISGERIRDELLKILGSEYPYEGIMLLKNTGLLQYILPELLEGIDVSQVRPGRHHTSDVFTHNLLALKLTPATDPIVRLATLIHDVGKPRVRSEDENGYVIFFNHEVVGSKIAYGIANRFHLSKKEREKIVTLVRWHMFTVDEHITDAAVRRFIRRVGVDNVKDMIDLRIGDRLGSGTETAESWRLKDFKKRIEEQLQPGPFSINDLAIDGNDIMQEMNLKPGREIGELLQKLFLEVDEDLEKNTKEYLLQRLHEIS